MKRFLVLMTVSVMFGSLFAEVAPAGQTTKARTDLILATTGEAADGSVTSGQKIKLVGQLISRAARCERNKRVTLFIDGRGPFAEDFTDDEGYFSFSIPGPHPTGPHEFQAKRGSSRRCRASVSNVENVRVTSG